MSLDATLNSALTGLTANQVALRAVSENVANVNTENYVRREVVFGTRSIDGVHTTVNIDEIRRVVDDFFRTEALEATGEAHDVERRRAFHDRLQAHFGAPGGDAAFSSAIDKVFQSFNAASVDASSSARRVQSLRDLGALAESFNDLMGLISEQRIDVDRQVSDVVIEANALFEELFRLNTEIEGASLGGRTANGLLDRQDIVIARLSEFMDVRVVRRENGRADIMTSTGLELVGTGYAQLDYPRIESISDATVFPQITLNIVHPESGQPLGVSTPLDPQLNSGALRGLIDLRDHEIPNLIEQTGAVAAAVADLLNAAHNDNASAPPPSQLVGRNTGLLITDEHNFTGETTLAVTDDTGALQLRIDVNFDTNAYSVNGGAFIAFGGSSVGSLTVALNGALGGFGTASFNDGVLSFNSSSSTNGFAFLQDETNPSSRGGRGFSHFFGLNDLLTASSPTHFKTGLSAADGHGFTPGETVDFVLRGPNGERIERTFTVPGGASVNDLLTELNSTTTGLGAYFSFTLDADGELDVTPQPSYASYQLFTEQDNTQRGTTGVTLTGLFGIGPGPKAGAARGLEVPSEIANDPARLAFAKLEVSAASVPGDIVLSIGDNRGALSLGDAQSTRLVFDASGFMPPISGDISEYAAQVLTSFSTRARFVQEEAESTKALQNELALRRDEIQGVNLDEELSLLLLYQKAYNASARVVSAAQELLDQLLNVV